MSRSGAGLNTTYEYTVENRLKAVREGGRLLMAASYDGDGNRILEVNLRPQNYTVYSSPAGDEAKGGRKRAPAPGEEETDEGAGGGAVAGGGGPGGGGIKDPDTPEEAYRGKGGIRNIFIFGFLSFLKNLFMPFTTGASVKAAEPAIEYYWYHEIAAAGISSSDIACIQALDLRPEEAGAILSAPIPALYDGWRSQDTYELTRYVNDTNRTHTEVLMEYAGSGGMKAKFTYGNERLYTSNAAAEGFVGKTVAAAYYYDGHGSVTSLLTTAGSELAAYTYGPFGESNVLPPYQGSYYGYSGEKYDPLSALQYLRARYYAPDMGRFTVADTYPGRLIDPLFLNKYSYVQNDPVNFIDPSGHTSLVKLPTEPLSMTGAAATEAQKALDAQKQTPPSSSGMLKQIGQVIGNNVQKVVNTIKGTVSSAEVNKLSPQYLTENAKRLLAEANKKFCTGDMMRILSSLSDIKPGNVKVGTIKGVSLAEQPTNDPIKVLARLLIANPMSVYFTQKGLFSELFSLAGFVRTKDLNGNYVYHAKQNAPQAVGGYNELYDIIFNLASSMDKAKFSFSSDGKDYIFWIWKGDYLNLGAGAEFAPYEKLGPTEHYIVNTDLSMNITMNLSYKGESIISWDPAKDKDYAWDEVWWSTGFNPDFQGVDASDLTASFTVTFDNTQLYDDFIKSRDYLDNKDMWTIDPYNKYKMTFEF